MDVKESDRLLVIGCNIIIRLRYPLEMSRRCSRFMKSSKSSGQERDMPKLFNSATDKAVHKGPLSITNKQVYEAIFECIACFAGLQLCDLSKQDIALSSSHHRHQPRRPSCYLAKTSAHSRFPSSIFSHQPSPALNILANVCLQDIVGPVKMGSTGTIDEIYKLFTSLSLLRNWVVEYYVPALEDWLADLSVDS